VTFCDLVGSTELSERLDPEELREVVRLHRETCARVIRRFEGYLAKYLGDGLLVYFGYPHAHEEDAERAVRAGLALVDETQRLNPRLEQDHGIRLAVRVGIHTGLVVAGEMGATAPREPLGIIGETPNIAARLEGIAEPNTVVISDATLRLVPGLFITQDSGTPALKGVTEPIRIYRVIQPSGVRSRLEAAAGRLSPFVGRQEEIGLLLGRWEQVEEKLGQVVLISGEAGVGKSRLVQVLRERLAETPHTWLECRCSPYAQASAFYPVIELLQQGLNFAETDSPDDKLGKLERGLERAGFSLPEVVPLLASLLSLPLPDHYSALRMSPELQRRKTLDALVAWTVALGERQPVLFLYEDLHWCDPSTLEVLSLSVEQVPTTRVLLLLTSRPEFQSPWPPRSHHTPIVLKRLSGRQARAMVAGLTPRRTLPEDVIEPIVTRADGMPLFVEELTKMVLESGLLKEHGGRYALTGSLSALAIPTTLQDSLMARLDRLGAAKDVAQLGATLGREFSHGLLQAVSSVDEPALRQGLARLIDAEVLYQRGLPPQATYLFKHSLIQEAAYDSLLKSTRRQYHEQIARVLEDRFPEQAAIEPELVARHYDEAGIAAQAIAYYQRAGDEARTRSANVEAIAHLERAVELTLTLAEGSERNERELGLQLGLGAARNQARGPGSEDTRRSWERARVLCEGAGTPSQLATALRGLAVHYTDRSELDTAIELADELIALAQRIGDDGHLLLGHTSRGSPKFWQGRFRECLEDNDAAFAIYDPKTHAAFALTLGLDQAVLAYGNSSWALWFLGYPEQAAARGEATVEHARTLAHPYSLALALFRASVSYNFQREWDTSVRHVEEAIELSERHGLPLMLGLSNVARALPVACHQGEDTVAVAKEGLGGAAGTGSQAGAPMALWIIARIHQERGREADALGVVEAALATSAQGKQPFYDAELLRLKGELLLSKDEAEAESHFRRALHVARAQEARSFELRTATNLAHLWQKQGRKEDARQLLAPIYAWFTEGFDTLDLKDAKTLLEELGA
jgi:class 3 adenylate cyclase/tetratricopeptide (TPR) repeat protein